MRSGKRKLLLTGAPGTGKTTVIREVALLLQDLGPVGFWTEEIRERGERVGFRLVGIPRGEGMLAHVRCRSQFRVGKYGVDVHEFGRFLSLLPLERVGKGIVIIDEIGRMECFSARFRALVERLLESDALLIATIALRGDGFIEGVKRHPAVELLTLTKENRDRMPAMIAEEMRGLLGK